MTKIVTRNSEEHLDTCCYGTGGPGMFCIDCNCKAELKQYKKDLCKKDIRRIVYEIKLLDQKLLDVSTIAGYFLELLHTGELSDDEIKCFNNVFDALDAQCDIYIHQIKELEKSLKDSND